jgi:hypothetical protein
MFEQISEEINRIKERNNRVELDKAWERSFTRRFTIMALTYVVAVIWLLMIDESDEFLKALVPVFGYLLSTLSLPFAKRFWLRRRG